MTDLIRAIARPDEAKPEQLSAWLVRLLELEIEGEKLRKLCKRLIDHIEHPPCDGCGFECDGTDLTRCDEWSRMEADARELGVTS